ncbi:MAG: methyltransferase domain-containing protein [Gammaproteobacteria bacterium]
MPPEALHREYAALAAGYEQRWRHYLGETTRHALNALAPQSGERILDVACGTGFALARLAEMPLGLDLAGVDINLHMLARSRVPATVELVHGDAHRLPFADGRFDAVITLNALHYLDDPAIAIEEMARLLRPGGRLVATDWCRDFFVMFLCEHWLRIRMRPLGRVLETDELATLVEDAGLRIEAVSRFKVRPAWGLMTLLAHRPD